MGTSSIFNGPTDKNPLLPDGFEEEMDEYKPEDEEDYLPEDGLWQDAKTSISKYINNGFSDKRSVVGKHVKALGGAGTSAKAAVSGRKSTVRLGSLLKDFVNDGVINTLNKLKIDYVGKSVESLLSELVNILSEESVTKEDIVAKNATIEAMSKIYEYIEDNEMDIKTLENMGEDIFNEIMSLYISSYIFERMFSDLESRLEKYADNEERAYEIEVEFKDYIQSKVEIELSNIQFNNLDYDDLDIQNQIQNIYRKCYEVMEVLR
ncbi:Qat anti-phage system associated protein QatB [Pontibacillus marinus]|uniref:Uncharacterized protein n=1 Tax=Pontibacillus marinus BH030004 = DSM 16465 TaxID=1385511 RepID=A0A0A5HL08_9BACI|nr:Qat anti-phage system associated protein QatB [Pontibacillus marinus]KGX84322.1 hypothetical protein N783_17775 [Pontibacillus marinus BH030004 = DSM 16465]